MSKFIVQEAKTSKEISDCWPALHELRPNLIESEFLQRVQGQQKEGYRLLYAKNNESDTGEVLGILGFRIMNLLFNGKNLYIDDLGTRSKARCQGIAGLLIDNVETIGKREKCNLISLESGFSRHNAHRLYHNKRFTITDFHFEKPL